MHRCHPVRIKPTSNLLSWQTSRSVVLSALALAFVSVFSFRHVDVILITSAIWPIVAWLNRVCVYMSLCVCVLCIYTLSWQGCPIYVYTRPRTISCHGVRPTCTSNWVGWCVKTPRSNLLKLLVSKRLTLALALPPVPANHTVITIQNTVDTNNLSQPLQSRHAIWYDCMYVGHENVNQSQTVTWQCFGAHI